jgi:DNA invertase Pin-like site-specific DNA recombinase
MQERLHELGWRAIEVVDDDLGRSAAGTVTRTGFERMVAEVCLGKVGAVAAREVSRFARNNRDWQQLVEVCRVVDTVLIDQDTVYAPRHSNDRLLLGLKGSLNEYELDQRCESQTQDMAQPSQSSMSGGRYTPMSSRYNQVPRKISSSTSCPGVLDASSSRWTHREVRPPPFFSSAVPSCSRISVCRAARYRSSQVVA